MQLVVMGHERTGCCTAIDRLQNGRLYFKEIIGIQKTPNGADDLCTGAENILYTRIDDQIRIALCRTGVRETRRITGLKEISDHDVEVGTHCGDVVVHNAWFLIDIHNPTGGGQEEGYSHMAQPYDIPYGAIVPKGVDGLLTSGRCISGTHRANASYRVSAICMMTGQAAGAAAALCSRQKILPRFLDITDLQKELTAQGCNLAG